MFLIQIIANQTAFLQAKTSNAKYRFGYFVYEQNYIKHFD